MNYGTSLSRFFKGMPLVVCWAVSYAVRPTLVFDVGFNHGLSNSSTRWEAFAGFTYLLPHRLRLLQ